MNLDETRSPVELLSLAAEQAGKLKGVEVCHGPRQSSDQPGSYELRFLVQISPFPNPENLPEWACIRVHADDLYPLTPLQVYSEEESIQAFPHQDAETHKLCLYEERYAPQNLSRLSAYLEWTQEWLGKAATNLLLAPGEAYELPDFSRRSLVEELPTKWPILIDESHQTFFHWRQRIPSQGDVDLIACDPIQAALAWRFSDDNGDVIRSVAPGPLIGTDPQRRIAGRFILLPRGTFFRHRPPQTYGELQDMCRTAGMNLMANVQDAWERKNKDPKVSFLLIGFPIPRVVGEPSQEIHWQPLWFSGWMRSKLKTPRYGTFNRRGLWNMGLNQGHFASSNPLPWGRTENIAPDRLYARGGHAALAAKPSICIAGCGALGACFAELIARGGAQKLNLIDKDFFELGNQSRHTLTGTSIGQNKATSLAQRLAATNPLSQIDGHIAQLPLASKHPSHEKTVEALQRATLIIDCTTDPGSTAWLSAIARNARVPMAKLFVNVGATMLTMCVSGQHASCIKVYNKLMEDIRNGTPITWQEHDGDPDNLNLLRGIL